MTSKSLIYFITIDFSLYDAGGPPLCTKKLKVPCCLAVISLQRWHCPLAVGVSFIGKGFLAALRTGVR